MNELEIIDRLIKAAEKGGALSAAGILFLGNVVQALFIAWNLRAQSKAEHERNSINEKSIEARLAIAQALGKVADRTEEISDDISELKVVLRERLPGRA